jgi:hypothetical protein
LSPVIRSAGVEQAAEVHRLMRLGFEEYRALLKQPSGALSETVEDVRAAIGREPAVAQLGIPETRVSVRATLPSNLRFYENLGYRALESEQYPSGHDFSITLRKRLPR